jgi:ABC-type nitrate/sulfonate/bicarbonate transport system substrate-binding protein
MITNRRVGKIIILPFSLVIQYFLFFLPLLTTVEAAEPLKKMRVAIPSIVIDFAPLWIARDKGLFRDERLEVEITYIQGNIRGVQSLLAAEVQYTEHAVGVVQESGLSETDLEKIYGANARRLLHIDQL